MLLVSRHVQWYAYLSIVSGTVGFPSGQVAQGRQEPSRERTQETKNEAENIFSQT